MTARKQGKRAKLISFSGIDGAGKSIQIANLCSVLHEAGITFQLITFWDDVATFKGVREGVGHRIFKGDKGVGTPEAPIQRRDKNVQSPLMTLFRMGMYIFDAAALRKIAKHALRSGVDVVIFDRYLYDELANLNLKNTVTRLYLREILKLVPRPLVSFMLDADPKQAFARKPEYPLDFLYSNRKSYLTLSRIIGGMTVIRPAPILQAKQEVVRHVFHALLGRNSPIVETE